MMDDSGSDPYSESENGLTGDRFGAAHIPPSDVIGATDEAVGADPHDNLWWFADGSLWDLGPAELDADADRRPESLTSELDGETAMLSDSDGDGRIDRMSVLHADGRVAAWEVEPTGEEWSATTRGRLP